MADQDDTGQKDGRDDDRDAEVIYLQFDPVNRPPLDVRERHRSACTHRRVIVDEVLRTVECRDCNAKLDAVQVLIEYGLRERRFCTNLAFLRDESQTLKKDIDRLKAERKNLRAAVARARATARKKNIDPMNLEPQSSLENDVNGGS